MPIRLILMGLVLIALVNWTLPPLSAQAKRKVTRWSIWIAVAAVLLLLLRFGMVWLALIGTGLVTVLRWAMPSLVRLLPLWLLQRSSARMADGAGPTAGNREPFDPRVMTRAQALEVLNLREGASREEIMSAYRDLIQKVHPDKGGSSYLAAQVNRARDVLLS